MKRISWFLKMDKVIYEIRFQIYDFYVFKSSNDCF